MKGYALFWKPNKALASEAADMRGAAPAEAEIRALGWPGRMAFGSVAREVVARDILDPLAAVGITITSDERASLLG